MEYTKGEWKVTNDGLHIYSEDTEQDIASIKITGKNNPCRQEAEANARRICLAVNSHDDLLAACKAAKKLLNEVAEMNIQPFPISAVQLNRDLIKFIASAEKS